VITAAVASLVASIWMAERAQAWPVAFKRTMDAMRQVRSVTRLVPVCSVTL